MTGETGLTAKKETYASSGVQIDKAESFVERIKKVAKRPAHDNLWKGAGGYASVYPINDNQGVAVTTDGVGTKLLVANELHTYNTIGIDLVAMVANDLICVGATPTIFLDYYAVGKLDDKLSDDLIAGIVEGCDRASMILAGGETAEMPGLYEEGHYDLAGFAVGSVEKDRLITGENIKPGQKLVAVASSGIHSNGLSLARKVLSKDRWHMLLQPTAIYVKPTMTALGKHGKSITGIAHITGGGWRNLLRLNSTVGFSIENPLKVPDVFSIIGRNVEEEEMYKTYNMGMGLGLIAEDDAANSIVECFKAAGHEASVVGTVNSDAGTIMIKDKSFVLKDKHS